MFTTACNSEKMSRGQSQQRSQSRRRVLERCKTKSNTEIIDVDKDKIDVVIIDAPETSHQGSRGSRATRRKWCPSGVIRIDDEEGGTDDTPRNVHGDAASKAFCPAFSNSPMSEESQSDECLMSFRKGDFPFKSTEYMRRYHTVGSSINRFGLGFPSKSSTSESDSTEFDSSQSINSESDSSDCEIIEDSSGNIREQWERAALRRKMSERGRFGSDDCASASGSSADPGFSSGEATQSKIDVENCINKADSNHFEEMPPESSPSNSNNGKENLSFNMPAESSPSNSNNGKENLSFNMPAAAAALSDSLLKTKATTSVADTDPTADLCHNEPGFQKKEHISETCSHTDQSTDETLSNNKRAGYRDPEIVLGLSLGHSKVQHDMNVKDDGLHSESSFQDEVGPCTFPQPRDGKQVSPDSVGSQDKKEYVPGEPSCFTKSQCCSVVDPKIAGFREKEKSVFEQPSLCDFQLSDGPQLNVDGAATFGELVCNSLAGNGTTERSTSHTGAEAIPQVHNDLIWERERHKESAEYRRAVEEEWESRQRQLQIQAEEAQRLRRRRKAENLRLLDMEKRQKQRLAEIRESQKKDEETINLKEQLRAEVRKELEKMELRYRDMASLLRGLGIHVEGGLFPMSREVNAAYKQALLRFHPDRASRTDIRQQVKAEETFKLISRLKEKLLPVL